MKTGTEKLEQCFSKLSKRIITASHRINPLLKNRWFRLSLQISIILTCFLYLRSQFYSANKILQQTKIDFSALALAILLTTLCVFLGSIYWWLILRGLGSSTSWLPNGRAHMLSNLAKYIPGYAWQFIGKAYLSKQIGIPSRIIGVGMFLEMTGAIIIGFGLSVGLFPAELIVPLTNLQLSHFELRVFQISILFAIIAIILVTPFILKKYDLPFSNIAIKPLLLWSAALTNLIAWLIFGMGFWLIGTAFQPLTSTSIPAFIFVLVASIVIGLLIIIVPGSFGVRESIMVFLLAPYLSSPIAVIVAISSRLVVTISELLSVLVVEIWMRGAKIKEAVAFDRKNTP